MSDTIELHPGDLVRLKRRRFAATIWDSPLTPYDNRDIGTFGSNQIAIVIDVSSAPQETLIMTSDGVLGWVVTSLLRWVSDGRRAKR